MLEPYRVLDLTDERGWLAGKILGDLGADVIKVEPPGGDSGRRRGPFLGGSEHPARGLRWLALNTSKRSVVLDLEYAEDRERFLRLVASADALLESANLCGVEPRAYLREATLRAVRNPGTVTLARDLKSPES